MSDIVTDPSVRGKRSTFFRLILGRTSGYACIAFLSSKKKFREEWFKWPEEETQLLNAIELHVTTDNIYFCPQLFNEKQRKKEHVSVTPNAWADLDFCAPNKLLVQPTVTLESSPGRYQAFWIFDREVDPDDAEDLSRRIAYKHADQGADRSGWDLTQLLRIPFTYNYKYYDPENAEGTPTVEIFDANNNKYRMSDFSQYPATPSYAVVEDDMPDLPMIAGQADELLHKYRTQFSPMVRDLYLLEPSTDWSASLWKFIMLLFEAELQPEEVFIIAREAACNKYARDGKPALMLWKEVMRAKGRAELHHDLLVPKPEEFESLLTEEEKTRVEAAGDTFVERYIQWASSLGDAATQYHQAGAFVALSSLLAGSVRLPTSYGTVIPNIWFMILADTTLTRKTTSMDIAMDLIEEVDDDIVMATDGSIEGLLTSLSTRPGRPSIFLRDEFSGLLEQMTKKDYMAGMPELLTKLYDGKMQKRILRKETIEVRDPRLIMFAGGIKNRITGGMNYDMVSSGFMPRFVFITAESDIAKVRPIGPPTQRSTGNRDAVLAELTDIYKHYNRTETLIIEKLKSTIERRVLTDASMTDEAWVRYNKLENQMLSMGLKSQRPDIMTPIGDRLSKSILKAALLIAASQRQGEDLVIEEIDILRALKYGEQWSAHSYDIMENVGKGTGERQLDTVLRTITRNPSGISRSALMQAHHLNARDTTQIFETLEQRGLVTRLRQGKTEVLKPTTVGVKHGS